MTASTATNPVAARISARLPEIANEYPFTPHFHDHPSSTGDGVRQAYLDEGPSDGEAVLCVHGNPTWSFAFRHLVRALSDRWRVVVPDHVGCGMSDRPDPYSWRLAQHVENLEALVLALDLRDITLVLHDWGGAIGMGFARRHPDRIARIVVMNTGAFASPDMPLRIAACRIPVLGRLAVQGLNGFALAATRMAVERPLSPSARRGYLLPYRSPSERRATHAFVEDIPMDPGHPSWDELAATEAALPSFGDRPTCILWGERDWCFTPAFRRRWQQVWPAAQVTLYPDAGHYLFEDENEGVCAQVRHFLESSNPRGEDP